MYFIFFVCSFKFCKVCWFFILEKDWLVFIFFWYEMIGLLFWFWLYFVIDLGLDSCDMVDLMKWWIIRCVMVEVLMVVWNCFGFLVVDLYYYLFYIVKIRLD